MWRPALILGALGSILLPASGARAFQREPAVMESPSPASLTSDCVLLNYNLCSCWIWVFTDAPAAVWGEVFDPGDCAAGCESGGAVTEIWLFSRCSSGTASFQGVGISTVDAAGCLVSELFDSGPFTTTHCVSWDRWAEIPVPSVHVNGEAFAVTVTWGSGAELATENAICNLLCYFGTSAMYPACYWRDPDCRCFDWELPPIRSYIYVTDVNGDTILDDLCELYGYPDPIAFPYYYPYGYFGDNLLIRVGLDCTSPTSVEATSWGHVKALYE